MLRRRYALCLLLLAAFTAPVLAHAGDPPPPMAMLKAKEAALRELLASPKGAERTQRLKALADTLIDYDELARLSLGKRQWGKRSEAEQAEFRRLLQALIEKNYVEQAERDPEFRVQWLKEEMGRKGDRARVVTLAASKRAEIELECRLMLTPKGWIVYNLLIDGVSMTRSYRKTFKRIIRKQGFDKLLERMRRKLAGEADEEIDSAGKSSGKGKEAGAGAP